MVITEVRIKLMEDNNENERLQAFCSVTFDDAFVVRDLKIIEGTKGSFVAMPRTSRNWINYCVIGNAGPLTCWRAIFLIRYFVTTGPSTTTSPG